jgi:hypothetical protein
MGHSQGFLRGERLHRDAPARASPHPVQVGQMTTLVPSGAESAESVQTVLAAVLDLLETTSLRGHAVPGAHALLARARAALSAARPCADKRSAAIEIALRDLVWRIDHVGETLRSGRLTIAAADPRDLTSAAEVLHLLDTTEAAAALSRTENGNLAEKFEEKE